MAKNLEQRVTELEKQNKELAEQIKALQGSNTLKTRKNLGIGDTFELAGLQWKILDITEQGYKCLAERLEDEMQFDNNCSNWAASNLRNYLHTEFYDDLAAAVGADNIVPFERNLLSLDGQTEYGKCEDKVSLLNVDEYRQYRALIPNTDYYWWMITPWSTPCNGWDKSITVVCPSGSVNWDNCNNFNGVRPFCIFSSSIFESEE